MSLPVDPSVVPEEVTEVTHRRVEHRPGLLNRAWNGWLKFAVLLGNIQMTIILSVLYWTFVALFAIPFRLLADPLSLRSSQGTRWVQRPPDTVTLDSMRKQY